MLSAYLTPMTEPNTQCGVFLLPMSSYFALRAIYALKSSLKNVLSNIPFLGLIAPFCSTFHELQINRRVEHR